MNNFTTIQDLCHNASWITALAQPLPVRSIKHSETESSSYIVNSDSQALSFDLSSILWLVVFFFSLFFTGILSHSSNQRPPYIPGHDIVCPPNNSPYVMGCFFFKTHLIYICFPFASGSLILAGCDIVCPPEWLALVTSCFSPKALEPLQVEGCWVFFFFFFFAKWPSLACSCVRCSHCLEWQDLQFILFSHSFTLNGMESDVCLLSPPQDCPYHL